MSSVVGAVGRWLEKVDDPSVSAVRQRLLALGVRVTGAGRKCSPYSMKAFLGRHQQGWDRAANRAQKVSPGTVRTPLLTEICTRPMLLG